MSPWWECTSWTRRTRISSGGSSTTHSINSGATLRWTAPEAPGNSRHWSGRRSPRRDLVGPRRCADSPTTSHRPASRRTTPDTWPSCQALRLWRPPRSTSSSAPRLSAVPPGWTVPAWSLPRTRPCGGSPTWPACRTRPVDASSPAARWATSRRWSRRAMTPTGSVRRPEWGVPTGGPWSPPRAPTRRSTRPPG